MKTLSRCRNNIEADNVVLIDVDTYNFHNVIVLDIPESLTKKQGGSNDKKRPLRTYIYIDDDESPFNHHSVGAHVDSERKFENGASSSKRYGSENTSPVKLSKGKRTYSGRGFNAQSDCDSSDDEGPDCEFMEDFSGKLREQWEKASLKRKGVAHNDHTRSSMSYGDGHSEFGVNKNTQTHAQGSNINGTNHEKKGESSNCYARDVDCGKDNLPVGETSVKCDARNFGGGKDDLPLGETPSANCDARDVDGGKDDLLHGEATSASSEEANAETDSEIAATIDDVPIESSIIDQREKLKETDEYKRALEEELSARQKALQIQAEEAQQLRRLQKRKKAEGLRLLDMERRQKQRVEEIREIQKKDEENMNLKEQHRMEVRQELKKLELTCLDMASLLRGLGIKVGNGPVSMPHEVRAAYKRALLSFHPDRASGSDMRQQVEAEEKFKLISRMKEKFSL